MFLAQCQRTKTRTFLFLMCLIGVQRGGMCVCGVVVCDAHASSQRCHPAHSLFIWLCWSSLCFRAPHTPRSRQHTHTRKKFIVVVVVWACVTLLPSLPRHPLPTPPAPRPLLASSPYLPHISHSPSCARALFLPSLITLLHWMGCACQVMSQALTSLCVQVLTRQGTICWVSHSHSSNRRNWV